MCRLVLSGSDRHHFLTLMRTLMKLGFNKRRGISGPVECTLSLSRRTLFHEVTYLCGFAFYGASKYIFSRKLKFECTSDWQSAFL